MARQFQIIKKHMEYNKKIFVVGAIIIAILILTFIFYENRTPGLPVQKEFLSDFGFKMADIGSFTVKEKFNPYFSGHDYEEENIFAQKDEKILNIKIIRNIANSSAEKYAREQFLVLMGLFDAKLPPYPEFLTNQTGCAEEFLPGLKEARLGDYYTVYADERFNYGICSRDLVKYKAGVGVFYCEANQKLFKIEYFINNTNDFGAVEEFMNSFECADTQT